MAVPAVCTGENINFEPPLLNESDILQWIQNGDIGESVRNITLEQLKNPTPALALQLCACIIEKLDFDCDNYNQALIIDVLSNPDLFRSNIMLILNFTEILNRSIPKLALQPRDLLYPKWKQLRRFLSSTINYVRSWDENMCTYEELSVASYKLAEKSTELKEQNAKLETVLQEVNIFLADHENEFSNQREELAQLKRQFDEILKRQSKLHENKAAVKKEVSQHAEELEMHNAEFHKLVQEKDNVSALVVSSPDRLLSERQALEETLNIVKGECMETEDKVREVERKVARVRETYDLIEYDLQQLAEAKDFMKSIRDLRDSLRKNHFETESRSLEIGKLRREVENLTLQLASCKEQARRTKLRLEKQLQNLKQNIADMSSEIGLLHSQAKTKGLQVKAVMQEIEVQDKHLKDYEVNHKANMETLLAKKNAIFKCLEEISFCFSECMEHESERFEKLLQPCA